LREEIRLMIFVNRLLKKVLVSLFVFCVAPHFEAQNFSPVD